MSDRGGPLSQDQAKRRIQTALSDGAVSFTSHAFREMENDKIETPDVLNVLRGGWPDPAEWENGEWRYRVHTRTFCVVVSFPDENRVRVITAWRNK